MRLFRTIDDDGLLDRLVNTRTNGKDFRSLVDVVRRNTWYNKEVTRELVLEVVDYLKFVKGFEKNGKFDTVFDGYSEYLTNPFLTACKLGRIGTIRKLLDFAKDDESKEDGKMLRGLLLDNFEKISGDNCLMILYENGHGEYIVELLQFLKENEMKKLGMDLLCLQNLYNEETLLMQMCKKEKSKDMIESVLSFVDDDEVMKHLLNKRDIKGNCALDHAKKQIASILLKAT